MSLSRPATAVDRLLDRTGMVASIPTPPSPPRQVPQLPAEAEQRTPIQPEPAPQAPQSPFVQTMNRGTPIIDNWLAKKTPTSTAAELGQMLVPKGEDGEQEAMDESQYYQVGMEAEGKYAHDNPEILQRITDGSNDEYILTPAGEQTLRIANKNYPDAFVREETAPNPQPKNLVKDLTNHKLSALEQYEINSGSVAHVVDPIRKSLLYQAFIPEIVAMEKSDDPALKQQVAKSLETLNTVARSSGKPNYLDYTFEGLQDSLQVKQTHYDPQNNPMIGFVDGSATPAIFKKDGGSEAESTFKELMAIRFLNGREGTPKQRIDLFNRNKGKLEKIAEVGRGIRSQLLDKESLAKTDGLVGQIQMTNDPMGKEIIHIPEELASLEGLRIPQEYMSDDPLTFAESAIALADYMEAPHYKQVNMNLNVGLEPQQQMVEQEISDDDKQLLKDNLKLSAMMGDIVSVQNPAGNRKPFGFTGSGDIPAYYQGPRNAWANKFFEGKQPDIAQKYLSPTQTGLKTSLVGGLKDRNRANLAYRNSAQWDLVAEVAGDWAPGSIKLYREHLKTLPKDQPVGETGKVPAELLMDFDKTLKDLNLMSRNANAVKKRKNNKRQTAMLAVDYV